MAKTAPIPGTSDLFADELVAWKANESAAEQVFSRYGYGELRTPIFERSEVFLHNLGSDTEVVQKEMYTFNDAGGRSLSLRPEGTAGVMRAIGNIGLAQGDERRVYYHGPMFRGERPAAGRKRQFHQVGVECVGKTAPHIDVECMAMLVQYLDTIGLSGYRLLLNTRGLPEDRAPLADALRDYFQPFAGQLCTDCQRRLDTNVARILDCKVEDCRGVIDKAPAIADLLSDESREYFAKVCDGLTALDVPFEVAPHLIRGLDYYVHTVFEICYEGIGAQNALAGGGRYVINVPGISGGVHGVGFAAGMERLLLAQQDLDVLPTASNTVDAYLVSLGAPALSANMKLAASLRDEGLTILQDLEQRGMRGQMRTANKVNARWAIIRGDSELENGTAMCKDMDTGDQVAVSVDDVYSTITASKTS